MKNIPFAILISVLTISARGQTTDRVGRLVAAENYFSALAKEKGIRKAFLQVSDENTILFRPDPVKAFDFFKKNKKADSGILSWQPVYARISKSDDWGFTTGPYIYKQDSSGKANYGQYVSIWKKNPKGIWKLALDLGISHSKPKTTPKLVFTNPISEKFRQQPSTTRLQQREDIVLSSDQLFATILKADNKIARKEFLTEDSRLLFPGYEPIIGKKAIADFWEKQGGKVSSVPAEADRAYSGELAYTYGTATLTKNGKGKDYYYLRIWEVQPGFKWNVLLEVLTEK